MDSGPQRSGELSTQAWLQILEQFTQIHDESQVIFSGGEPLLRPDFLHIARRAQSLEHHLTLLTNGTLIQDRERARALAAACDWIQISLDGATAEVHDAFWGSGNFHRAIRALRLLGGMDVHLRVAVTAMPQNADDLAANLVDLLLSLGGSRLNVAVNHAWSEGRARSGAFCSTPSAMNEIVAALLRDLHAHGWQGTQPRRPRQPRRSCGYGGSIVVGADGSVYPCAILGEPLGNARTTSLGELGETLWRIYERNTVDHMPVCADCDLRYICGGGCRMRNLREEDDLRQPTCTEESKAAIYRQLLQDVPEDAERLRATYGPNAQIAVSAKRAN